MELTELTNWFIEKCFRDGEIRSIHPIFGEKYTVEDKQVKFTEELYEMIAASDRVKATRTAKSANITGVPITNSY